MGDRLGAVAEVGRVEYGAHAFLPGQVLVQVHVFDLIGGDRTPGNGRLRREARHGPRPGALRICLVDLIDSPMVELPRARERWIGAARQANLETRVG